jgi:hypothetical protein
MAPVVEVGLADGTKLIIENASEDEVLQRLAQRSDPIGAAALDTQNGTYHVLPENVVYVRYVSEDD